MIAERLTRLAEVRGLDPGAAATALDVGRPGSDDRFDA
jgi:hypothetical protein